MAVRKGFPSQLSGIGAGADDMRYNLRGLIIRSTAGVIRSGLFPSIGTLLSATGTMNVSVAAFNGVALRDGGPIFLANDGAANVLLTNAPASNSRLDVIYAKQDDSSTTVTTPDGDDLPLLGVLTGIPAASPVRNPAGLPAGALELGTVLVPSTATNTGSAGVVITPTFQYTTTVGGKIWCRNATEVGALSSSFSPHTNALALDTLITYVYSNSAWIPWSSDWITYTPTLANITLGTAGTSVFQYRYEQGSVRVRGRIKLGTSGGAMGTSPTFTLPAASRALVHSYETYFGNTTLHDEGTPNNYMATVVANNASTTVALIYGIGTNGTAATITATAPFTWGVGDAIDVDILYETH